MWFRDMMHHRWMGPFVGWMVLLIAVTLFLPENWAQLVALLGTLIGMCWLVFGVWWTKRG
jgi:hypothetical protein